MSYVIGLSLLSFFASLGILKLLSRQKWIQRYVERLGGEFWWTLNLAVHGVGLWKNIRRG